MSNVKCCDFHDGKMTESEISHKVIINGVEFDCCDACLNGTVILAEHRRTRTRKLAKAKVGRPKGSRTRKAEGIEIDTDSKASLGLEA